MASALTAAMATVAVGGGAAGARVSSATRGVTNDSISVAGLAQQSQFTADELELGVKARFEVENKKGGVFGRELKYVEGADDKGDPTTGLSEARRLVQQDQVFAIVPALTPFFSQSAAFFAQQHVPFFGWGIDAGFCKNPYAFGFTGCIVPPKNITTTGTTWGDLVLAYYKDHGGAKGRTAAVIAEDNDTGKTGAIVIGAQARKAGLKVVYQKSTLPTTPPGDYSPFVNAILSSNKGKAPDVVFVVTSVNNTLRLPGAIVAAGYNGVLTNAVLYDPRAVSLMKGNSVFTQFDVPEDTSNTTMQQIVRNIQAVGGSDASITQAVLASYFSADAFIAVLKKVGKNLTAERMAKVMSHFTYEIPGIVGPTKYPAAQTQGAPCGTLVASDGSQWSIQVPYNCYKNFNYKTGKFLKY